MDAFILFSTNARFFEVSQTSSGSPKYIRVGDVTCQVIYAERVHQLVVSNPHQNIGVMATVDSGNQTLRYKGVSIHDRKSIYFTDDNGVSRMLTFDTKDNANSFTMAVTVALYCASGQPTDMATKLHFLPGIGLPTSTNVGDAVVVKFMGMIAARHPDKSTYILADIFESSRDDDETTFRRIDIGTPSDGMGTGWESALAAMIKGEIRYFAMAAALGSVPDMELSEDYILVYCTECHSTLTGDAIRRDSIKARLSKFTPAASRMLTGVRTEESPETGEVPIQEGKSKRASMINPKADPKADPTPKEKSTTAVSAASSIESPETGKVPTQETKSKRALSITTGADPKEDLAPKEKSTTLTVSAASSINVLTRSGGTELENVEEIGYTTLTAEEIERRAAKLEAKKKRLRSLDEEIKRRERDLAKQQHDFEARTRAADMEAAEQIATLQTEMKKLRRELALTGNTGGRSPTNANLSFGEIPGGGQEGSRRGSRMGNLSLSRADTAVTAQSESTRLLDPKAIDILPENSAYEEDSETVFPPSLKNSHYLTSSFVEFATYRYVMYGLLALLVTGVVFSIVNTVRGYTSSRAGQDLMWIAIALPAGGTILGFTLKKHTYFNLVTSLDRLFHSHVSTRNSSWDRAWGFTAMAMVLGACALIVEWFMVSQYLDPLTFVFPPAVYINIAVVLYILLCREVYIQQVQNVLSKESGSLTTDYAMRDVFVSLRQIKIMLQRVASVWAWYFLLAMMQHVAGLTALAYLISQVDNFQPSVRMIFWDFLLFHATCLLWVARGWKGSYAKVTRLVHTHFDSWAGQEQGGELTHRDYMSMISLLDASVRNDEYAVWKIFGQIIPEWSCFVPLVIFLASVGLQIAKIAQEL